MEEEDYIFLKIARLDLQACQILYENSLYSQAIFYLQQSIEKAVKQIALMGEIIEEGEEIGHEPLEFYQEAASQEARIYNKLSKISEEIPELEDPINSVMDKLPEDYQDQIKNARERLNEAKSFGDKRIFITEEELGLLFEYLDKIREDFDKGFEETRQKIEKSEITDIADQPLRLVMGIAQGLRESDLEVKDPDKVENFETQVEEFLTSENFKQLVLKSIGVMRDLGKATETLRILSLTMPKEQAIYARYPVPKKDHNPLEVYTEDLPLVKRLDELISYMESVFVDFESFTKTH